MYVVLYYIYIFNPFNVFVKSLNIITLNLNYVQLITNLPLLNLGLLTRWNMKTQNVHEPKSVPKFI